MFLENTLVIGLQYTLIIGFTYRIPSKSVYEFIIKVREFEVERTLRRGGQPWDADTPTWLESYSKL